MTVSPINTKTASMLSAYKEEIPVQGLLTSFYKVPAIGGIHNQDEIEYDRQIEDELAAPPVDNSGSNYNINDFSGFDKDKVAPVVYKEAIEIPAAKLGKLQPGQKIYDNTDFQMNGTALVVDAMGKLQNKVKRSLEIQAAQIFTTGKLDLKGIDGETSFALDFGFDGSRFFDAESSWDADDTAYSDLQKAVAKVRNPKRVIMDSNSFHKAIVQTTFKSKFTFPQNGTGLGVLKPGSPQEPYATMYMGQVVVGAARLDMWVYDESYKMTVGGSETQYLAGQAVVMNDDRKDATFGGIPNFGTFTGGQRALDLPTRMSSRAQMFDMTVNSYIDRNEVLFVGIGTRPLLIPRNKKSFSTVHTLVS